MANTKITTNVIADDAITSAKLDTNIAIAGTLGVTGNITGTLATAAQPNITSVGTLTGFTSTGIDDNADATAITIDSSENVQIGSNSFAAPRLQLYAAASGESQIFFGNDGTNGFKDGAIRYFHESHGTTADRRNMTFSTANTERMRINATGVGIGMTPAPGGSDTVLSLYNSATPRFRLHNSTTGTTASDGGEINMSGSDFILENREAGNVRFFCNDGERMRIDSSGLVGLGSQITSNQASTYDSRANDFVISGSGDTGMTIAGGGSENLRLQFTVNGDTGLNRGEINYDNNDNSLAFATAGSNRMRIDNDGSIHVTGSSPSGIYLDNNNVRIYHGTNRLLEGSTDSTAVVSLAEGFTGYLYCEPTIRAKRGISFGTDTATANQLDDYEEGTWIPTDASGQGITGFTLSHNQYTKIGRKVFAHCQITFPSSSNTTLARLSLPFAPNASSNNSATGGVCQEQNIGSSITVVAAVNYTNGVIFRPNGYGSYTYADLSGKTLRFAIHYNAS